MKLLRLSGLIATVMLLALLVVSPVFALIAQPDSAPTVDSMNVYRNLAASGDRLFVFQSNVPYAVTPAEKFSDTYSWQLVNGTDNSTVGATAGYSYIESGYGKQCFALYFTAADGVSWDPATAYILRLVESPLAFASPRSYDYTIASAYYSSLTAQTASQTALATYILDVSNTLDAAWALGAAYKLTEAGDTGTLLSGIGQAYYRGSIPGIQAMAPSLFNVVISSINVTDRTWTDTYATALKNQYSGTWIDTARAGGAALFGTGTFDVFSLLIVIVFIALIVVGNILLSSNAFDAMIDVSFFLVIATRISLIEMGYLGLVVFIAFAYIGINIWNKIPK